MSHAIGAKLQLQPGSWAEAVYEVAIGVLVGTCHVPNLVIRFWTEKWRSLWRSVDNGEPLAENELEVVAVGYGRTGTVSSSSCMWCQLSIVHQQLPDYDKVPVNSSYSSYISFLCSTL